MNGEFLRGTLFDATLRGLRDTFAPFYLSSSLETPGSVVDAAEREKQPLCQSKDKPLFDACCF